MSTFINLKKGNRLGALLGYDGPEPVYAHDYNYIEVGLKLAYKVGADGKKEVVTKAAPGDFVKLVPQGTVAPAARSHALVVANGLLAVRGSVSYQTVIAPGDPAILGASFAVHESIDLAELPWLFRVYLID